MSKSYINTVSKSYINTAKVVYIQIKSSNTHNHSPNDTYAYVSIFLISKTYVNEILLQYAFQSCVSTMLMLYSWFPKLILLKYIFQWAFRHLAVHQGISGSWYRINRRYHTLVHVAICLSKLCFNDAYVSVFLISKTYIIEVCIPMSI